MRNKGGRIREQVGIRCEELKEKRNRGGRKVGEELYKKARKWSEEFEGKRQITCERISKYSKGKKA